MDDYIRTLLLESVLWEEAGDPERLRRQLSRETPVRPEGVEEPDNKGTKAEKQQRNEVEITEEYRKTAEPDTHFLREVEAGLEAETKPGLFRNATETSGYARWQAMPEKKQHGPALFESMVDMEYGFPRNAVRQMGDASDAFGVFTDAAQGKVEMTPEALSMFFQRDARRYS